MERRFLSQVIVHGLITAKGIALSKKERKIDCELMRSFGATLGAGFVVILFLDKTIAFDENAEGNLRNLQSRWSLGKVLTLGDSFASGTGIHLFPWDYDQLRGGTSAIGARTFLFNPSGGHCYREFDTTPGGRLANALGQQHIQMGCSSAQIDQIEEQFEYVSQMNPLETQMGWEGSTIVVFAGGNDIRSRGGDGWSGVIIDCILEQGDYTGCDDILSNRISNFDLVDEKLTVFYNQLASKAGNARIRIMGYPKLMQPHQLFGCSVLGIGLSEAGWIDNHVDVLNNRIYQAVARTRRDFPAVDIEFVGVRNFITKGACEQSETEVNGIVLLFGLIPTSSSFHPSQAGYNAYYAALVESLGY